MENTMGNMSEQELTTVLEISFGYNPAMMFEVAEFAAARANRYSKTNFGMAIAVYEFEQYCNTPATLGDAAGHELGDFTDDAPTINSGYGYAPNCPNP